MKNNNIYNSLKNINEVDKTDEINLIEDIIYKIKEYTFLLSLANENEEKIKYYKRKIKFLEDFFYFLKNQNILINLQYFLNYKKIDKNIYQKFLEIQNQKIFKNYYKVLLKATLFKLIDLVSIKIDNYTEYIEELAKKNLNNFDEILRKYKIFNLQDLNNRLKNSKIFFKIFSNFLINILKSLNLPDLKDLDYLINDLINPKKITNFLIENYYKQNSFFYEIYFKFLEIRNYFKNSGLNFIVSNSISKFVLNINEITFIIHYKKNLKSIINLIKNLSYYLNLKIIKIEKEKLINNDYLIKIYFYNLKVPLILVFSEDIFNFLLYDLYFIYKDTINEEIFFKNILKVSNYFSLKDFNKHFFKTNKYNDLKYDLNKIKDFDNIKFYELFYNYFGLNHIPSELSDYPNILEIAKNKDFKDLIDLDDIKGDLHIHTNLSDGLNSINEIFNFVKFNKTNYKYIGITDHIDQVNLNKLIELKNYIKNNLNSDKLKIILGVEENIDENGILYYQKLDHSLQSDFINNIDFINASIHSNFNLSEEGQYNRLIKIAKSKNPKIIAISHLTTRILNIRKPINLNINKILKIINKLNKNNKYIEINCHLDRLDVDYNILREYTFKYNILPKVVISTDSHNINHIDYMEYGVKIARKSLIPKHNVLNTKEKFFDIFYIRNL